MSSSMCWFSGISLKGLLGDIVSFYCLSNRLVPLNMWLESGPQVSPPILITNKSTTSSPLKTLRFIYYFFKNVLTFTKPTESSTKLYRSLFDSDSPAHESHAWRLDSPTGSSALHDLLTVFQRKARSCRVYCPRVNSLGFICFHFL